MATHPECPVCTRPFTPSEHFCPQCGWQLAGEYILGAITPAVQHAFLHDLDAAQRHWLARQQEVDLVCIIDLIGDEETIRGRGDFVYNLIKSLQQQCDVTVTLRVGLLAYGDHNHIAAEKYRQHPVPLRFHRLDTPEIMLEQIQTLEPQPGQDFEAALEDALAELDKLNWFPRSHRFMVIVGNRPPHPYKPVPGWEQIGSPMGHDWRGLIAQARSHWNIHSLAIVCPRWSPKHSPFPRHIKRYSDQCWKDIGYTGLFDYTQVTPEEVVKRMVNIFQKQINHERTDDPPDM